MARPIWTGHISFGLVNIPVSIFSAEERNDIHLKMIDGRNKSAIRYERINDVTGEEVPWKEIVKGYEYEKGEFILLTEEAMKSVAPEVTKSIDIDNFVLASAIEPQYFDKPYYLVPTKQSAKAYALLREALRDSERVAIATIVIRTRQYIAAISAKDKALILDLLRFHQELRKPPEELLPPLSLKELKISDREIAMAKQLIASMEAEWKPEGYKDEYRAALMEWIEKAVKNHGSTSVKHSKEHDEEDDTEVIDMMSLLKKSMEQREQAKPKPSKVKKA
jgi:DNA end-binding protein Ku